MLRSYTIAVFIVIIWSRKITRKITLKILLFCLLSGIIKTESEVKSMSYQPPLHHHQPNADARRRDR